MARTKRGRAEIYQLKVTLLGSKPPIWRRLQVPGDVTLYQLHHILQIAFDWTESHLHQFVVDDAFYGEPAPDLLGLGPPTEDEGKVRLQQVAPGPKDRFVYE
nr:plasmid pRiA4b ORF-3 family protein [Chloroflexia bacterium]